MPTLDCFVGFASFFLKTCATVCDDRREDDEETEDEETLLDGSDDREVARDSSGARCIALTGTAAAEAATAAGKGRKRRQAGLAAEAALGLPPPPAAFVRFAAFVGKEHVCVRRVRFVFV